tara:strand:+ start:290 stop:439 length:150 start_codon:yes stop_codon:yes gene_type:complete
LKVELKTEELFLLKQALENITIKGKDAMLVGKLLDRIAKAFEKESLKDT